MFFRSFLLNLSKGSSSLVKGSIKAKNIKAKSFSQRTLPKTKLVNFPFVQSELKSIPYERIKLPALKKNGTPLKAVDSLQTAVKTRKCSPQQSAPAACSRKKTVKLSVIPKAAPKPPMVKKKGPQKVGFKAVPKVAPSLVRRKLSAKRNAALRKEKPAVSSVAQSSPQKKILFKPIQAKVSLKRKSTFGSPKSSKKNTSESQRESTAKKVDFRPPSHNRSPVLSSQKKAVPAIISPKAPPFRNAILKRKAGAAISRGKKVRASS